MRGAFCRSRRTAAAWLLIVVLLAPAAFASDALDEVSFWDAFVVWLAGRFGIPGGLTGTDEGEDAGRISVPGGSTTPAEDTARIDVPNG